MLQKSRRDHHRQLVTRREIEWPQDPRSGSRNTTRRKRRRAAGVAKFRAPGARTLGQSPRDIRRSDRGARAGARGRRKRRMGHIHSKSRHRRDQTTPLNADNGSSAHCFTEGFAACGDGTPQKRVKPRCHRPAEIWKKPEPKLLLGTQTRMLIR